MLHRGLRSPLGAIALGIARDGMLFQPAFLQFDEHGDEDTGLGRWHEVPQVQQGPRMTRFQRLGELVADMLQYGIIQSSDTLAQHFDERVMRRVLDSQ